MRARCHKRASRDLGVLLALAGACVAAIALVLVVFDSEALARPGGGSSYSSGSSRSSSRSSGSSSSSSSSGGGGGGGSFLIDIFAFLLRLCFESPRVGVPLLLFVAAVVVVVYVAKNREKGFREWDVGVGVSDAFAPGASSAPPSHHVPEVRHSVRSELEELRASDENFSVVLLEDFLSALYVEVHVARGRQALARLSPYLAPAVQTRLASPGLIDVRDVLVGAMRFVSVDLGPPAPAPDARVTIEVELETNYTEVRGGAAEQAFYAHERWRLVRKRGVRSRTPDRARIFPCPSCGAPLDHVIAGTCRHCGQNVATGAFDWLVEDATLLTRETRGPMLTATTEEQGTDFETVVDDDAHHGLRTLAEKDPAWSWDAFRARVNLVFMSFQAGWANRDLAPMRPFMTDNLFHVQAYWVEAYKRQHLRNITERARITDIHLARVSTDRFFDAITIRVFATGLDYTLNDAGALVAGHRSRERVYSEYWTFVRGTGRKGPTRTDAACPNCGAPLAVNMAGSCQYCQAKVTTGEFDWVLSRIEQDDSYEG